MNYWEYIKVEELLALQGGRDDNEADLSNDEVLFIVVHQVYELWFKLILREVSAARDIFRQNPVPAVDLHRAMRSFRRVVRIFEQAIQHFQVMETLTTRDYLEFRDRLIPASGFQSAQMREIEILLGLDDALRVSLGRHSYKDALLTEDGQPSPATRRVEARAASGPSLRTVLYDWLSRTPIDGASTDEAADRFLAKVIEAHKNESRQRFMLGGGQRSLRPDDIDRLKNRYDQEITNTAAFLRGDDVKDATPEERAYLRRVRAALVFLESYRELPKLSLPREVIDSVLEMEQTMIIWRQRHARMVERVIGRRIGTGGSAGVDYLDQTAQRYRVFSDLWAVRTLLLRKTSLPPLEHEGDYQFRIED